MRVNMTRHKRTFQRCYAFCLATRLHTFISIRVRKKQTKANCIDILPFIVLKFCHEKNGKAKNEVMPKMWLKGD